MDNMQKVSVIASDEAYTIHYIWEVTEDTLAMVARKGVKSGDEKVIDFLSPIHTADADETKLSSLVASASAVCT